MSTYGPRALASYWNRHFLELEFLLAVAAGIVVWLWDRRWGGSLLIDLALKGNRAAIYGTLASICGSLLGFTITAVSIILGYSTHERMEIVRNSGHYKTFWKIFTSAIRALGLATLVALSALVVDRDASPVRGLLYVTVWAAALAIFRLARCIWAFEKVILIVSAPSKARAGDQP